MNRARSSAFWLRPTAALFASRHRVEIVDADVATIEPRGEIAA